MPSPSAPQVSIVIVHWNTPALLRACLESVRATCKTIPYEILVVDNASESDSVEWLRGLQPEIRLVANAENVGFARANNQGLSVCQGEFALLLNSDAQLQDHTLVRLLRIMHTTPRAAASAPMLICPDGTYQAGPNDDLTLFSETCLALGLARFARRGHYPGYDANASQGAYAWLGGTCLLMRRTAWEQIGLLDPDYFMYTEEADWCWRARQAGWELWYEPAARAIHLGGGSSRNAPSKMRAALFQKRRPRWQALALRLIVVNSARFKSFLYDAAAQINGLVSREGRTQSVRVQSLHERAASFRLVAEAVETTSA